MKHRQPAFCQSYKFRSCFQHQNETSVINSTRISNNWAAVKKVKVAHTRLPSVGFRSWCRFLAVSLQVTWVINPAVGCHYFPTGLQLPQQPLRGLLPILLLGSTQWVWAVCLRLLPDSVATKHGHFCAWFQHANHSATEPPAVVWRQLMPELPGECCEKRHWSWQCSSLHAVSETDDQRLTAANTHTHSTPSCSFITR